MRMAEALPRDPERPQKEHEKGHAAHVPGNEAPSPPGGRSARPELLIVGLHAVGLCRAAELQTTETTDHALGRLSGGAPDLIELAGRPMRPTGAC